LSNESHIRWLQRELPELVSQGVLPAATAQRLQQHYGDARHGTATHWAIILFGILGTSLVGGGIILLLAHNWEQLSRPMRACIAIAPLLVTAALGAWLLWTRQQSTAWREGVATAQTLAIGISIALVAQTYNIGGRFDEFMLSWSLLALPLAYLLQATTPMLLYLTGIAVWSGALPYQSGNALWALPLLGLSLPLLWSSSQPNRYHPRPVLLLWVLVITFFVVSINADIHEVSRFNAWPLLFTGQFALLYLIGAHWWNAAASLRQAPLQTIGALGCVILALVLSSVEAWPRYLTNVYPVGLLQTVLRTFLLALFPLAALVLWIQSWHRQAWHACMLGAVMPLAALGCIASLLDMSFIGAILFNLYLAAMGISTLVSGFRTRRLATVNAGMAILAALILLRFFDSNLGFVMRGIAFILIGCGFLATNLLLLRRRGEQSV
jgi:uncharacterized membrane protein